MRWPAGSYHWGASRGREIDGRGRGRRVEGDMEVGGGGGGGAGCERGT